MQLIKLQETMISTLVLVLIIQLAQSQDPCNVFHNSSCPMEQTNLVWYYRLLANKYGSRFLSKGLERLSTPNPKPKPRYGSCFFGLERKLESSFGGGPMSYRPTELSNTTIDGNWNHI